MNTDDASAPWRAVIGRSLAVRCLVQMQKSLFACIDKPMVI